MGNEKKKGKNRERKLVCDDDDGIYTKPSSVCVCVYVCCVVPKVGAGKGVSLSLERTLVGSETLSENLEETKEENNHNNLAASAS